MGSKTLAKGLEVRYLDSISLMNGFYIEKDIKAIILSFLSHTELRHLILIMPKIHLSLASKDSTI
jgi:hypothetical protein